MKRKKIIVIAIWVVISGFLVSLGISNYTSFDKVKFGYLECLKLDSGEYRVNPIDTASVHEFMKDCQYDSVEIYLNRVLMGKYKTLIAMSTRNAPQEYIAQMKKDSLLNIYQSREYSKDLKLYYAFFIKRHGRFIYRTLYVEPKYGNMILLDMTNKDSLEVLKLYNDKNYLSKKLNCD